MSREAFLTRISDALGRRRGEPITPPPAIDESLVRLCGHDEDIVGRFADEARAAGMSVHRTTRDHLAQCLRGLLAEAHCRSVAVSVLDPALSSVVSAAANEANSNVIDWHSAPGLDAHFDVDAGITDVDAALAETGTLIVSSGATRSRGGLLVPPIHIAIVHDHNILPDMVDFRQRERCSTCESAATTFVTGPSKTADIEGILVTGVHGPREVHILLVTADTE